MPTENTKIQRFIKELQTAADTMPWGAEKAAYRVVVNQLSVGAGFDTMEARVEEAFVSSGQYISASDWYLIRQTVQKLQERFNAAELSTTVLVKHPNTTYRVKILVELRHKNGNMSEYNLPWIDETQKTTIEITDEEIKITESK